MKLQQLLETRTERMDNYRQLIDRLISELPPTPPTIHPSQNPCTVQVNTKYTINQFIPLVRETSQLLRIILSDLHRPYGYISNRTIQDGQLLEIWIWPRPFQWVNQLDRKSVILIPKQATTVLLNQVFQAIVDVLGKELKALSNQKIIKYSSH